MRLAPAMLVLVVAWAWAWGCGRRAEQADPGLAAARPVVPRGKAWARGAGVAVAVADVEARARRTGEAPRTAAEAMLREALLAARAERVGLDDDDEAEQTRRQVMVQRLLDVEVDRKVTAATIPAAEVEAAYQRSIAKYVHGDRVTVEHYLVKVGEAVTGPQADAARAHAERFREAARTRPDVTLETIRADVPSVQAVESKIERLPPFERGSVFHPTFEAAALRLREPGELSPVFRTPFGFHVVRLIAFEPAKRTALAEVEAEVRDALLPEMRKRRLQMLIATLSGGRVEVDPRPLALLPLAATQ